MDTVLVLHKKADGTLVHRWIPYSAIDRVKGAKRDRVEIIGYRGISLGDKPRNVADVRPDNRTSNYYLDRQQARAAKAQARRNLQARRQNPKGMTLDKWQLEPSE